MLPRCACCRDVIRVGAIQCAPTPDPAAFALRLPRSDFPTLVRTFPAACCTCRGIALTLLDPDSASLLLLAAPLASATFAVEVGIFVLLLLASAFFSGSEVALFSLDAGDREDMSTRADARVQRVLNLLAEPRALLVSILILNTLANVAAAIIAALMMQQLAGVYGWSETITILVEVVALTFVLLVLSEITPKLVATQQPETFSLLAAGPLSAMHAVLRPVSRRLARLTERYEARLRPPSERLTSDDLHAVAEIGEETGMLHEDESDLIHAVVDFGGTTAREIMVSRVDMYALPATASLDEALALIQDSGHSRLPLYLDHLDNILGIVYAKDILPFMAPGAPPFSLAEIHRDAFIVPETKRLDALLNDFRRRRLHMAIVVDEYGGTSGLVTMEDLLEEVVGEIRDERDEDEPELFTEIAPGIYQVDARSNLDDLNEELELGLDTDAFDFDTLGGFILHVTGSIPAPGDVCEHENLRLTVESVENHRIGQVRIEKTSDAADA